VNTKAVNTKGTNEAHKRHKEQSTKYKEQSSKNEVPRQCKN